MPPVSQQLGDLGRLRRIPLPAGPLPVGIGGRRRKPWARLPARGYEVGADDSHVHHILLKREEAVPGVPQDGDASVLDRATCEPETTCRPR